MAAQPLMPCAEPAPAALFAELKDRALKMFVETVEMTKASRIENEAVRRTQVWSLLKVRS